MLVLRTNAYTAHKPPKLALRHAKTIRLNPHPAAVFPHGNCMGKSSPASPDVLGHHSCGRSGCGFLALPRGRDHTCNLDLSLSTSRRERVSRLRRNRFWCLSASDIAAVTTTTRSARVTVALKVVRSSDICPSKISFRNWHCCMRGFSLSASNGRQVIPSHVHDSAQAATAAERTSKTRLPIYMITNGF